jgi:uncharacterized protein (TIGR03435 family)
MGSAAFKTNLRLRLRPLVLTLLTIPAIAQQPSLAPPLPAYDVVSIHPHNAHDENVGMHIQPSTYAATNITLKELISYAYRIREDLISGLPTWADSAHFDVTAKISDPDQSVLDKLSHEQIGAMCRPLLADRFHLKVHNEIKTLPVYDLVLTRDGPKFKPSPPLPEDPDHPAPKGQHRNTTWQINNGDLTALSITMNSFAVTLADQINHVVIDKTALTDAYDLKLKWTRDEDADKAPDNGAADHPPGIFTALEEQLGLKLVPAKGPVTTLVVDQAEKPSPN